jgi:hypothetical protein
MKAQPDDDDAATATTLPPPIAETKKDGEHKAEPTKDEAAVTQPIATADTGPSKTPESEKKN